MIAVTQAALAWSLAPHEMDMHLIVHSIFYRQIRHPHRHFFRCSYTYWEQIVSKRKLRAMLDCLVLHGILECDDFYVIGVKCLAYRINRRFMPEPGSEPFFVNIETPRLLENIQRLEMLEGAKMNPVDRKLKVHCERLSLRVEAVKEILEARRLDPGFKFIEASWAIDAIYQGFSNYRVCQQHRRHTVITSLPKAVRSCLFLPDEPSAALVELDIRGSQPMLICALASLLRNKRKRRGYVEVMTETLDRVVRKVEMDSVLDELAENNGVPTSPQVGRGDQSSIHYVRTFVASQCHARDCDDNFLREVLSPLEAKTCGNFLKNEKKATNRYAEMPYEELLEICDRIASDCAEIVERYPGDFEAYLQMAEAGVLYERLFFRTYGRPMLEADKPAFKVECFAHIFYGPHQRESELTKTFAGMFPGVFRFICSMKRIRYQMLPCLMQRIEADILIDGAAADFLKQSKNSFLATIHDSFICREQDVPLARRCIEARMGAYGIRPSIRETMLGE